MERNEKLVGVLNDLVRINNDRIEGYEKAIKNLDGNNAADLTSIYNKMIGNSRSHLNELQNEIARLGGEIADGTTASGKVYRVWMDIKSTFSGDERTSSLEQCEFGEDAAQKAYEEALDSDAEMSAESRQLITEQKASLLKDHDQIKALRDAHHAVDA